MSKKDLIREIDIQIGHHEEEDNIYVVRSLKYIKGLISEGDELERTLAENNFPEIAKYIITELHRIHPYPASATQLARNTGDWHYTTINRWCRRLCDIGLFVCDDNGGYGFVDDRDSEKVGYFK